MAHPCILCGSECYCNGSWDDVIVDKTPKNCEGCGCEEFWDGDDDIYDDDDDFEDANEEDEMVPQKDGGLLDPENGIVHYP